MCLLITPKYQFYFITIVNINQSSVSVTDTLFAYILGLKIYCTITLIPYSN